MKLSKKQAENKIRLHFHEVQDHTASVIKEASLHTGLKIRQVYNLYSGYTTNPRPDNLRLLAAFFSVKLGREVTIEDLISNRKTDNIGEIAEQAFK